MNNFKNLDGRGILIHHWDTDGIASASLILKYLTDRNIVNKTLPIGNYFLTEQEYKEFSKYDFIIIADISLPEENILLLHKNVKKLFIFDHHLGKEIKDIFHHNPIIKGEPPEKYPSTSFIVNSYFGYPDNLYSFLGIVGDHEENIKKNKTFNKKISNFCTQQNITFEDMLQMVSLIDSNYKIGDVKSVEQSPRELLNLEKPHSILTNKIWINNYNKLRNKIEEILESKWDETNGLILKEINTSYNIISTITREIIRQNGRTTIVINKGYYKDKDQIYVRSYENLENLIQIGKSHGFNCGGKKEVFGAIIPKEKTKSFSKEIINFFNN